MAIEMRSTPTGFWGRLLPRSRIGWSAVGLAAGVGVFLLLVFLSVAAGQTGYALTLLIPLGLSIFSGLAALVVGVIGITAMRERSILAFVATAVGVIYVGAWVITAVSGMFGGPQSSPPSPPLPPPPLG